MNSKGETELRKRAEELQKGIDSSKSMTIFEGDVLKLLHELEVYQIELALSNEELVLARDQAEALSKKYTALFDFAPMGYLTIDKAATISELNFSAAKMLGKDRSALLGKDMKIYFNINDLPRFSAFVIQVFYSKTKQICELKLKRSEKNARAFCRLEGVVDVDGNCMIAMIDTSQGKNDETALRKAHEKAEGSKKYLNSIINKIGDPFFVKDEQSRLLLANDSFCKLFGVPKKDIIGKTLAEDVSAVEREHFLKIDKQVIATGKENIIEESLTLKGQKTQTISTRKTRYVDTEGKKFLIGTIRDVTEQKKAADKLRQSSQLLEASQAAAHVGGWELNLASGDLFWTAETYRIHDTSPEEFEPTTDAGVHYYLPESRDIITEALRGAIEEGKGYDLELEIRTQKGRLIQVRTTCEVTLQEGRASRFTGIFQDITDQKLAEISLKRSKVKFEKLSNLTFEGIVIHKDGIITDHNASFTRLFGYDKENLIGQSGTELFIHPSKHQSVYDKLKEHITRPYTSVGIKKDGTEFPIEIEGKEFTDESGEAYRVTAIRDITKRVAHEAKLKESEEKFRNAINYAPYPLMIHADGKVLQLSEEWIKQTGYTIDDIPTIQKWSLLAYEKDAILSEDYIINLYNLEQPQLDGEWEVKIKDGSYVLWNFSSSPFGKLPNGKKMVISMASDISEINKYKEHLEELVDERTTDLELRTKELNKTNEELIFAQSEMHKALFKEKELGELKSQFVSTASHQFRTPLTVIQSNVELMEMNLHNLEGSTRNRFEKSIERINNETHRMTALMNDVLLLGKINASADISNHEWINITTTTRDLIDRLNEINTLYARINLEVIGEPKEIFLDENQYSHILLNVLGNAQKYSLDRGDVTFQVRFEKEKVKLVIMDQGIGMSEEDTKRIFNPFTRGKNAEGIQGTGLGMSIVHEYVKLNHGTIEIESQLNVGTTVVISFTYNEK